MKQRLWISERGTEYLGNDVLGTPLVSVPIVNHDNSQHAKDENLRLQNLWDGIEIYAAVMARLEANWPR